MSENEVIFGEGGNSPSPFPSIMIRIASIAPWILVLLPLGEGLFAQSTTLRIRPFLGDMPLEPGKTVYLSSLGDSVRVDTWRCLLSGITFLKAGSPVGEAAAAHWLLDAEDSASLEIRADCSERPDAVRFLFGVDSLTSVSGAYGGALDPTQGMYWTWQSGYIFLKMEGWSPASPGRKQEFHYHIGGYGGPFKAQREVTLALTTEGNIPFDLDPLLEPSVLQAGAEIMSPGARAAAMADILVQAFRAGR
jgi:hypothetical protein